MEALGVNGRWDSTGRCARHREQACASCLSYDNGDLRDEVRNLQAALDASLAREAVLRDFLEDGQPDGMHPPRCKCLWHTEARAALSNTPTAVSEFLERVRAEEREKTASRAAEVFKAHYGRFITAASLATERAIRALGTETGPKETKE